MTQVAAAAGFIMPTLRGLNLAADEREIVDIILDKGRLRITPPRYLNTALTAKAAYVWRLVVFYISPFPAHHFLPPNADNYLYFHFNGDRTVFLRLHTLVQKLIDTVPRERWPALAKWGQSIARVDDFFSSLYTPGYRPVLKVDADGVKIFAEERGRGAESRGAVD